MFHTRWQILRAFGIPIYVDASWLIILALLTLSFSTGFPTLLHDFFPGPASELAPYWYWALGLITALAFFACIVLHELGHALVARSRGMPIEGITLFLFGGVAEIREEPRSAGAEFLMAAAGPAVSLVLAVAFWILAVVGYRGGWPAPAVVVFANLALVNGLVLAFNLLPAFPLDGGRVLRSILWGATRSLRRATRWASLAGQGFAGLFIAWGVLQALGGNLLGGLWIGLIGLFLNNAARGSYQDVLVRQALRGEPVRRFMTPDPVVVSPSLDLRHWVEDYVYRYHHRAFPVASDGRLEGLVTTRALGRFPQEEWAAHTVREAMTPDLGAVSIPADADALEALGKMQRDGASRLLVTDAGRLVGIVSLKDLLRFLDLKLELEGSQGNGPEADGAATEAREEETAFRR